MTEPARTAPDEPSPSESSDATAPAPTPEQEAPPPPAADAGVAPVAAASEAEAHDAARRAFFFEFGKQAVTAVGQVAGMANVVSRTSSTAAASLLGLGETTPVPGQRAGAVVRSTRRGGSAVVSTSPAPAAGDDAFRSSYRLAADELMLLDQRTIPDSLDELTAKRGSDVAYYLRIGAVRGGPVMAQVAAYGLALTAQERADQPHASREVELRRTRRALAGARPSSRLPAWAMARMEAVEAGFDETADGTAVAQALRAEADAIAFEFQAHHSTIAANLADVLPDPAERPLAVLVHGNSGALAGGLVGTGLTALRRLAEAGRELRIFVTEGRPFMDGARLASWELRQADLKHQVIVDSAAAWLFARETIDAVLIDAEWIAASGDVGALVGSRAIAQQAAAAPAAADGSRPKVIVCGVTASVDPGTEDGDQIPVELRPARDLAAYLADVPIRATDAVVPATDVVPATAIAALVTERGTLSPLEATTLATLIDDSPPPADS